MQMSNAPEQVPELITHYIGGEHVPSAGGQTFGVLDPATNTEYTRAAAGQAADVDRAVAVAAEAFRDSGWADMRNRARAGVLNRIADGIEARGEQIARWESFDTGLPISQVEQQAKRAAENFRFFADLIVVQTEEAYRVADVQLNYVVRKPKGVAGLITPWNTPFMLESWKLAPALASGCTVVLKPAEWSPLSVSLLPEIFAEAGVPAGVFNIVHGIGEQAGDALVRHPDVPVLSFTGETATGQVIMRNAADGLKGLSMELGGKSPNIIFADADLDAALDSAIFGVFSLNGERCTAGSRVLVHRSIYADFVRQLGERAARFKVGPPGDRSTELGALIHPEHFDKVIGHVAKAEAEGARLVTGGKRPDHLPDGNFLEPTVFADVTPEHTLFREEVFGPVVAVTPFDDEAEAVRLANDTKYGLAAYVWTNDLKRGLRVANQVEAGMLWLNSHNIRDLRTPFGGIKASGVGHEGGTRSIDFYTDQRVVHAWIADVGLPRFGGTS
ncbi:5-carboxymethyl-2-hydroxymuconate semialdehyde dehydrogenase [Saccharopolyspora sp. 5N102]|uniref:5-carboxymethyl-2-hydroxymuconate semialdehyde dehydrogenase n=1 Tax=Saccharopolyspora sp. 5N102 TaxID=3375155 RepID=UPI00379A13F5